MPAAMVIRSAGFIGDPEAILRSPAGLQPQATALETKHLSRSVVGRVLVADISVQISGALPEGTLQVALPQGGKPHIAPMQRSFSTTFP